MEAASARSSALTRSGDKRAAVEAGVLRATEELLSEGLRFADLGIEKIAKRAGISRTAFYFYFRDRRELLMRLTEEVTDALYETAEDWWAGEAYDEAHMRGALTAIADLYVQHTALLRVIVEVSTYDEEVAKHWRSLLGRFVERSRQRIEADQDAGVTPASVDASSTAFVLVWMTERVLYEQIVQADVAPEREALIDALAGVWVRAVYPTAWNSPVSGST